MTATSPPPPTAPAPPGETGGGTAGSRSGLRRAGGAVSVAVLIAAAVYGGNLFGVRDRLLPAPKPAAPIAHGQPAGGAAPVLASQPWWQGVTALQGAAMTSTDPVTISGGALQWRISYSCRPGGRLTVRPHRPSGDAASRLLVDSPCPASGSAYSTDTGTMSFDVSATSAWKLQIDQQVDIPFVEPPLPAMSDPGTVAVSKGTFYDVDNQGHGRITVYRLAGGGYALRLEDFYVTPNSDLDLRFSTSPAPHSDGDVTGSTVAPVTGLNATAGSMNFMVPRDIDPTRFTSIAVWCIRIQTVYAAAVLRPAA